MVVDAPSNVINIVSHINCAGDSLKRANMIEWRPKVRRKCHNNNLLHTTIRTLKITTNTTRAAASATKATTTTRTKTATAATSLSSLSSVLSLKLRPMLNTFLWILTLWNAFDVSICVGK